MKSIREQSFNLFLSRSSQMSGVSSISPELQFSEMDIQTDVVYYSFHFLVNVYLLPGELFIPSHNLSIAETFCMDNFMILSNINCLPPKQLIEYQGESRYDGGHIRNKTSLQIGVTFEVAKKEVKEEVYVLSTREYIGSIGGSLGLFLGFSFYTFTTDLLDRIVSRF